MRLFGRSEHGLTLIETMAAIFVFALMTVGITPLLAGSLRGSDLSRSYTRSRGLVSESMERARGLPYFVSVGNQVNPPRLDVLDLYFPTIETGAGGYNATVKTFTTTCTATTKTPAANAPQACPRAIPAGHTVAFTTQFVKAQGVDAQGRQTYIAVDPAINPVTGQARPYAWNALTTEIPPSNLLRLVVTATWPVAGRTRTFSLESFLGDRRIAADKVVGEARLEYLVQATTGYADTGGSSSLVSTVGHLVSSISSRATTVADRTARAGRLDLTRAPSSGGQDSAASSELPLLQAPPNQNPTTTVNIPLQAMEHPLLPLVRIASLNVTTYDGLLNGVQVINDLPKAIGQFLFTGGNDQYSFSMDVEKSLTPLGGLRLNPEEPMISMDRGTGQSRINGSTSAEATALSPSTDRKVETAVTGRFVKLRVLPTLPGFVPENVEAQRPIIVISDFSMSLSCRSTAAFSTSQVVGTWSAQLKYFRDPTNDGQLNGTYTSPINLTGSVGSTATDPLAGIGNPLVYDDVDDSRDVYLFKTATRPLGYLEKFVTNPNFTTTRGPNGRTTEGGIINAIQIVTAPTTMQRPDLTGMSVSIGSASCRSVDRRGLQ